MPDMLVKLYNLPDPAPLIANLEKSGVVIRRAMTGEKHIVVKWVEKEFGAAWASECDVALANHPVSCYIAVENNKIVGFACHDSTFKNYFGPTGVTKEARGRGIGRALLLACLHTMKMQGYSYAIIGWAGPVDFYTKTVGATVIEDSFPGAYRGMLKS